MKKSYIVVAVAVAGFLLAGGGIFLWQENEKSVADLNKNLPKGIRVEKSFIGNNYKVVNKIDGYEFKVPSEWMGVEKIIYLTETEDDKYGGKSINVTGSEGEEGRFIAIDQFPKQKGSLEDVVRDITEYYELTGTREKEMLENIDVLKLYDENQLLGMHIYFFKTDSAFYAFTGASESYIREIIANGKW